MTSGSKEETYSVMGSSYAGSLAKKKLSRQNHCEAFNENTDGGTQEQICHFHSGVTDSLH